MFCHGWVVTRSCKQVRFEIEMYGKESFLVCPLSLFLFWSVLPYTVVYTPIYPNLELYTEVSTSHYPLFVFTFTLWCVSSPVH